VIEGAIRGNAVLAGAYTLEEAGEITQMLKSGTLPVSLDVESLSSVGPSLGQAIQEMGLLAMSLSLAMLVLLLTLSYMHRSWFLMASLCSLACLLFLITGLAAALDLTLDVVGIAGIILSVGMGMDACIIVLESLDEKLGRLGTGAITVHHDRIARAAYSFANEGRTLFHANATTLLVVALLLATERLKSFSLFMLVGIGASVLTILITREVLPRTYGWVPDLGGVLLLHGTPGGPSLELGPDFRAGTQLVVVPEADKALHNALELLGERLPDVGIRHQTLGPPEHGRYLVTVGTAVAERVGEYAPSDGAPTTGELFSIFASESVDVESLHSIDDKVSGRRLMTSLSVLILSFFLLAVYLVLLQEPLNRLLSSTRSPSSSQRTRALIFAGIMVAIVLDVAVMLATLSLLHLPISLAVVAGILAVIGYSVNDSVVLWCHIQNLQAELQKEKRAMAPLRLVTTAIDRISSRALLTTASTVLPALTILAVGLTPLADFAWVVIAGTVTGTLSSIFVVGSFALRALENETLPTPDDTGRQAPALNS
jgi:SecD/SecF fusion protein